MNEVKRIHLGRQPFTISTAAYKELKDYLAAIEGQINDKDVLREVELRMSELLTERGVTGDKAVLPEDVAYLKDQLGSPDDFGDSPESTEAASSADKVNKRLFRDTDNALIAGVAAGLAGYFGLDATLARLAFVLLVICSAGTGIVLYLLLWLVVPPADTASEKLQMRGRPVTLEALKDSVNKADVQGAARRVNRVILPVLNALFRLGVKLLGVGFIVAGIGLMLAVAITKTYMLLHSDRLFQENLFPVGSREHWLLGLAMLLVVLVGVFLLMCGIATFRRRWPIGAWITGILAGAFLIISATCVVLAADAAPRVRDRYETGLHTTAIKNLPAFDTVDVNGIDVVYVSSPDYAVNLHYFGDPDLSKIKVQVNDGTLVVDASQLEAAKHCDMLCLFPRYDLTVQVYAPNIQDFKAPPHTDIFYPASPVLD